MTLNLSAEAPNFRAATTAGDIDFHDWKGNSWAAMFSCPFAFTPICTTEMAALAQRQADFDERGVKVIVNAVDTLEPYAVWAADITRHYGVPVRYPFIADADRNVSRLYGMIWPDAKNLIPAIPGRWMKRTADIAVRTLFIISPDNRISAMLSYIPSVGLSFDEILRVIDRLQSPQVAAVR